MAQETNIQWCDATFNPWRGCTKVSAGCKFCYAETLSKRNPAALGNWGPQGVRVVAAESYWRQPIKWNANARTAGQRARVFCASLADVFEGPDTMPAESWPVVQAARYRLLRLIHDTPHLDWLLLTKRPENITPALESACEESALNPEQYFTGWLFDWADRIRLPKNVWLGTSVENQEQADMRVPQLLAAPAAVRFLSCEPLLGPVDVRDIVVGAGHVYPLGPGAATGRIPGHPRINWVIAGGESGPKARPMHPDWARGLRDQCLAAGVPFLFKQWGEYKPFYPSEAKPDGIGAKQRTDWHNWNGGIVSVKLGKHVAGRLLDGQEYNQFPTLAL